MPLLSLYKSGIYAVNADICSGNQPNHGVLLTGYGVDSDGLKYWTIKNSWGATWGGYGGYLRISRDRVNNCGISSGAILPIL